MERVLTQNEFDWLTRIEKNVDAAWDKLTEREQRFIENLLERFRQYGMKTWISSEQWKIIAWISEKVIDG
jgi:hypothetical protein